MKGKPPLISDSGVTRGESDLLVEIYRAALGRLKTIVLKPGGATAAGQAFRRARASTLVAQVDAILRQLKAQASGWVGAKMPQAYRDGLAAGDRQAEEAGVRVAGSGLSGSFGLVDQQAVVVLARDAMADLSKAADSAGDRAKRLLRQTAEMGLGGAAINAILAGGVIEGTPVETIRSLRDALKAVHGETVTIVDKNGRPIEFDAGTYAELVARTRTREAVEHARHSRLAALGIDVVVIIGRVSNTFCTAYLGKAFSLSGNHPKYPALSSLPNGKGPPFHPRCSKSTRPFVEELATEKQLDDAAPDADVAKVITRDPAVAQRVFKDLQVRAKVEDRYVRSTKSVH